MKRTAKRLRGRKKAWSLSWEKLNVGWKRLTSKNKRRLTWTTWTSKTWRWMPSDLRWKDSSMQSSLREKKRVSRSRSKNARNLFSESKTKRWRRYGIWSSSRWWWRRLSNKVNVSWHQIKNSCRHTLCTKNWSSLSTRSKWWLLNGQKSRLTEDS